MRTLLRTRPLTRSDCHPVSSYVISRAAKVYRSFSLSQPRLGCCHACRGETSSCSHLLLLLRRSHYIARTAPSSITRHSYSSLLRTHYSVWSSTICMELGRGMLGVSPEVARCPTIRSHWKFTSRPIAAVDDASARSEATHLRLR